MGKLLRNSVMMLMCVSLTSCFQIIEDLRFNADGSGEIKITINLSESKTKVKSIMLLDSVNGYAVPKPERIEAELAKLSEQMNAAEGLSKSSYKIDWEEYIFTMKCSFSKIDDLHAFSRELTKSAKIKDTAMVNQSAYRWSTHSFIRQGGYNVADQYSKLKAEDQKVFDNAQFIGVYKFEKPVKKTTNPVARISKSGTAVMVKAQILDLILGKADLANEIQF